MRHIPPFRVKVLMAMFYATGAIGVLMGLAVAPPSITLMITFLGVINIGLGAFFTYVLLTQAPKEQDKRKRKKKGT